MDRELREHPAKTAAPAAWAMCAARFHPSVYRFCRYFEWWFFGSINRSLIIFAVTLVLAILSGCSQEAGKDTRQKDFDQALRKAIASKNDQIDIAPLVNFEWEKVCAMAPYAAVFPDETIAPKYDVFKEIPWVTSETYWTVVFIDKHSKVIPLKIHRFDIADIVDPTKRDRQCAMRNNAIFLILKDGRPRLKLATK